MLYKNLNVSKKQKELKENQWILMEIYHDLTIIITRHNIYIDSWEEGNHPMKKGLLPIMNSKIREKYNEFFYYTVKEDISNIYKILDKILDTCEYRTVEFWEV